METFVFGVNCSIFALRRDAGSSSGSRVGHGSDRSHLDCGLCVALEEQVCIVIIMRRKKKKALYDFIFLSVEKRAQKEHMISLTGIAQVCNLCSTA